MITKDNVKCLTDDEVRMAHAEYVRRKRGGSRQVNPIDLQDLKPLDIFKPN
jgi:hypothetical protein